MTNIDNWAMRHISELFPYIEDNVLVGQCFTTSSFYESEHMGL